jgi:hypothetical protein
MPMSPVQTRDIESAKLRSRNQLGTELGDGEIRSIAVPVGLAAGFQLINGIMINPIAVIVWYI